MFVSYPLLLLCYQSVIKWSINRTNAIISCFGGALYDNTVLLDSELSMKQHVSKVASTCFYQLRRLKQIRNLVGQDLTAQLVYAFILSRLDYCNCVLAGLPKTTLAPLERVLNAAARLIMNINRQDHVTAALQQLHWLPI